jgi:hypothetical protein
MNVPERTKRLVVHPPLKRLRLHNLTVTGVNPRHRPRHLSLLPSGPDEVRDRLLRGGRSARLIYLGTILGREFSPAKADFG